MKNWKLVAFVLCGALVIGAGCSDDPKDSNNSAADVGQSDVGQSDVGQSDVGQPDTDVAVEDTDGEDDESVVTIERAGEKFPFTQAGYGLTAPNKAGNGKWELYIELWEGGFEGCPLEDSPSSSRSILVNNLSLDDAGDLVIGSDLSLVLLDYDGLVFPAERDKPVIRPVSVSGTGKSWEFCTECLTGVGGAGEKNGDLVVKLKGEFENGALDGVFHAQHCDSMDVLQARSF